MKIYVRTRSEGNEIAPSRSNKLVRVDILGLVGDPLYTELYNIVTHKRYVLGQFDALGFPSFVRAAKSQA
jgi:hypothetical protein